MPNYTYITDLLTPIADTGGSLTSEQVLLILSNLTTIKKWSWQCLVSYRKTG